MFYYLLAILLSLASCASIPQLQEEKKLASVSLNKSLETAYTDALFQKGNWPDPNWWEMFKDPQLNQLIIKGLENNPTMQKAVANMKSAWQMANVQKSYLWPELDFTAQDNWQYFGKNGFFRSFAKTLPPSVNEIDIDFNFFYEVDFWGKNRRLFQASLGEAKATTAESAGAALWISTAIALAYIDLQTDLKKLDILKQIKETRSSSYNVVNTRVVHAQSTQVEKIQANKPVLDVDVLIEQYKLQIELDKHLISALIGQGPDDGETYSTLSAVLETPLPLPDNIEFNFLSRRPDLMAQIWRAMSAAEHVGAAKTEFYPNFSLSAFGGIETLSFGTIFSWNSKMGSLLPAFTLPLFNAGRIRARVNAKEAEYESAVYAYNELLFQAAKEVADEISTFRSVNQQIEIQRANLKDLTDRCELVSSQFTNGIVNSLDVLSSQEEVLNQCLILADLEHNRLMAALKLIKALGGGYHNPNLPGGLKDE